MLSHGQVAFYFMKKFQQIKKLLQFNFWIFFTQRSRNRASDLDRLALDKGPVLHPYLYLRLETFHMYLKYPRHGVGAFSFNFKHISWLNRPQTTVICPWLTTIRKQLEGKECLCFMPDKSELLNERDGIKSIFWQHRPKWAGECVFYWRFNGRMHFVTSCLQAWFCMVPEISRL